MSLQKLSRLLTPEEVAEIVRVEVDVVMAWVHRDELDAIEITPEMVRIDPSALRRFLLVRRKQFQPGGWRAKDRT